jgi:hypothetical protein
LSYRIARQGIAVVRRFYPEPCWNAARTRQRFRAACKKCLPCPATTYKLLIDEDGRLRRQGFFKDVERFFKHEQGYGEGKQEPDHIGMHAAAQQQQAAFERTRLNLLREFR